METQRSGVISHKALQLQSIVGEQSVSTQSRREGGREVTTLRAVPSCEALWELTPLLLHVAVFFLLLNRVCGERLRLSQD